MGKENHRMLRLFFRNLRIRRGTLAGTGPTSEEAATSLHNLSVVVVRQASLGGGVVIGRGEARGQMAVGCPGSGSALLQKRRKKIQDLEFYQFV